MLRLNGIVYNSELGHGLHAGACGGSGDGDGDGGQGANGYGASIDPIILGPGKSLAEDGCSL